MAGPSEEQYNELLTIIQGDRELLNVQFEGPNGVVRVARKWEKAAGRLNILGGPIKTGEEWKSCWNGLKQRAREAARDQASYVRDTGGGPPADVVGLGFSHLHERVLQLTGVQAAFGNHVPDPLQINAAARRGAAAAYREERAAPLDMNVVGRGRGGRRGRGRGQGRLPAAPAAPAAAPGAARAAAAPAPAAPMQAVRLPAIFGRPVGGSLPVQLPVSSNVNQAGAQKATRERNLTAGAVALMQFNHPASEFIKQEAADFIRLGENPPTPESRWNAPLFHTPPCETGLTPARKILQLGYRPAVELEVASLPAEFEHYSPLQDLLEAIQKLLRRYPC